MNVTRQELKARAKAQLGGKIFHNLWLMALLVCLVHAVITGVLGVIPTVGSIAAVIVSGPLMYGLLYIFVKQSRDGQPVQIGDLFKGFTDDFLQTFLIYFLSSLFVALWSLLFVIPGIVKSYSYSMAMYIKIDNPEYSWKECINESRAMMNGHKMELFVQDLSFIGWYIVGAICLGVGTLWVAPYHQATRTHFYNELKASYVKVFVDPAAGTL